MNTHSGMFAIESQLLSIAKVYANGKRVLQSCAVWLARVLLQAQPGVTLLWCQHLFSQSRPLVH
jgi:hypothetical protein